MRLILTCAALAVCAACQQNPGPKADLATATEALDKMELDQIAAINAHDQANATAPYGDDAVFINDRGDLAKGRAQILAAFQNFVTDPTLKIDYRPGPKTFSDSGDVAYSTSEFTQTYTDPATKKLVTIKGNNLSIWRKQADGNWKLIADSNPGAARG